MDESSFCVRETEPNTTNDFTNHGLWLGEEALRSILCTDHGNPWNMISHDSSTQKVLGILHAAPPRIKRSYAFPGDRFWNMVA